jgi:hypothetical protein
MGGLPIDEVNRVLINKTPTLDGIVEKMPEEMYKNSRDQILNGFIAFLSSHPGSTARDFIDSLGDIRDGFEKRGIKYVGLDISRDFETKPLNDIAKIVSESAVNKSEKVVFHDAAHLLLVKNNRSSKVKSWFLTKDSTLSDASKRLSGKRPLIFSLSSFLQCISPFVQGNQSETLYMLFERVLEDDVSVRGVGGLFELSELKIINEYHQDIIATEPDNLTLAFEYVKSSLLNGGEITAHNQHKVSLEIKKFLQSGSDEQKRALQNEIDRQKKEVKAAEEAFFEEEQARIRAIAERDSLEGRLGETEEKLGLAEEMLAAERKNKLFMYILVLLFGIAISFPVWVYNEKIEQIIAIAGLSDGDVGADIGILLRIFGSFIFLLFSFPFCLWFDKKPRITLLTFSFMISLYFSKLFSDLLLSGLVNYWSVSLLFAGFVSWVCFRD